MDKNVTPSKTIHSQVSSLPIRQRYGGQRATTVPSSVSSLGTPHLHQNLRGKQLENPTRQLGNSRAPRVPRLLGKHREHHCFRTKRVCNDFHPKHHGPFPDRLRLPYPDEEIISGYEEEVSSIRDGFTAWVKADFETVLARRVPRSIRQKTRYILSSISLRQRRPQPFTCAEKAQCTQLEPRTRRGKEGAIEKQIAGKWHVIT